MDSARVERADSLDAAFSTAESVGLKGAPAAGWVEQLGGASEAQRPGIIVSGIDIKKAAQIRIERAQR